MGTISFSQQLGCTVTLHFHFFWVTAGAFGRHRMTKRQFFSSDPAAVAFDCSKLVQVFAPGLFNMLLTDAFV